MAARRNDYYEFNRGDGKKPRNKKGNKRGMNKVYDEEGGGDTLFQQQDNSVSNSSVRHDSNGNVSEAQNPRSSEQVNANITNISSPEVETNGNCGAGDREININSPEEIEESRDNKLSESTEKSLEDDSSKEMLSALTSLNDSFHSLPSSDEEEDTTIEEVVNASLIVNLSANNSSINITTSKDSEDSVNSSRSCPPDFNQVTASTPNVKGPVTFNENVSVYPAQDESFGGTGSDSLENSMIESLIDDSVAQEEKAFLLSTTPSNFPEQSAEFSVPDIVSTLPQVQSSPIESTAAATSLNMPAASQPVLPDIGNTGLQMEEETESADEEVKEINSNFLPSTVTELTAENGVKVFIVGTAHFSEQSQIDVMQTIQKVQPTLVLLELCHSRRNILMLDEETILREAADMSIGKIRSALSQSGTIQGTLHLLLLSMSAQLTKKLGMAPGGEFRVAMREAAKIPGCILLLGDRPFKVTLSRALSALTFTQKCKLAWQFLTSDEDITKETIEKCKERDLLERMLTDLTGEFPAITRVFVNERDAYLAHSLWLSATSRAHDNKGGPIVGVVGMGHVPGIIKNWGRTTEEQICDIVSIPETTRTSRVMGKLMKVSCYGLMAYGAYKLSRRWFDFPNVEHSEALVRQVERLKNVFA